MIGFMAFSTHHLERTSNIRRSKKFFAAKIVKIEEETHDVKSLKLEILSNYSNLKGNVNSLKMESIENDSNQFHYQAGQWVDFAIPGVKIVGGFSITSSPSSHPKLIELAVKKSLKEHPPAVWVHNQATLDDVVYVRVGGEFGQDLDHLLREKSPLLFIAGGIGINPLLSMIRYGFDQAPKEISTFKPVLIYSAQHSRDFPFQRQILDLHPNLKTIWVTTREQTQSNPGLGIWKAGRINAAILQLAIDQFSLLPQTTDQTAISKRLHCYLCGPPDMQDQLMGLLASFSLPKNRIDRKSVV